MRIRAIDLQRTFQHPLMISIANQGWLNAPSCLEQADLDRLRDEIFVTGRAGSRCLLDHPLVHQTAILLREHLVTLGLLDRSSPAIQAIAFDKTPETNWKVTWHQDLMFPFARLVSHPGYDLSCVKDGVHYARPPVSVLENLTAVRLSLDACDLENGPLRVSPGTHDFDDQLDHFPLAGGQHRGSLNGFRHKDVVVMTQAGIGECA
jgi:Phytanoyl-CoA dioxygenase (PhyH)